MSSVLHLDVETRSAVDLRKSGADVYARHPSTELLSMAWAFDDEPVQAWNPDEIVPDERVCDHIAAGGTVAAWNATFEHLILNFVCSRLYGIPGTKLGQLRCVMARSYAQALPGALENAAPAAGLTIQKDTVGNRVMRQLSQPRDVKEDGTVIWWEKHDVPAKFEKLYAYNIQDVEVERALDKRLLHLSQSEQKLWALDAVINARGVRVDVGAVRKAMELVEGEKARLDGEIRALTDGSVSTCTATGQLTDWLRWQGVKTDGVAKADVSDLLARGDDLPPVVRRVLGLRQEAAKASTAKLKSMLAGVCEDGRLRGMFQFNGAGATRRWAGRRVQLHNLPRSRMSQVEIEGVFNVL